MSDLPNWFKLSENKADIQTGEETDKQTDMQRDRQLWCLVLNL